MNSSSLLGVELAASSIPKGPECDSPSRRRNHSQITLLDRRRRDEDDDPASNNSSNNKRSKTGVSQRSIINSSSPSPSKYSGPAISNSLDSIQSYLLELVRNMQESFPYCKVASDRRSTYCYNRVRQQLEIIKKTIIRFAYKLLADPSSIDNTTPNGDSTPQPHSLITFIEYFNWICQLVNADLPEFDQPRDTEYKVEILQTLARQFAEVLDNLLLERDLIPRHAEVFNESRRVINVLRCNSLNSNIFEVAWKALDRRLTQTK